jgi:phosphate:Na+ symporter
MLLFTAYVTLFLFGMAQLSSTVQMIMTVRTRDYIRYAVRRPLNGILTGIFSTVLLQSSTATSVIAIGMVGAGLITFYNSLGVILGADIGTSLTVQLVVWKINKLSPVFITVGALIWIAGKGTWKKTGAAVFYFGLMLLGWPVTAETAAPLKDTELWARYYAEFRNPLIGFIAGAVFTGLVHSSLISISILAILAQQGLNALPAAPPVVLGANLATTVTALLASLGARINGRRSAVSHFIFKTAGAAIALIFLPGFLALIEFISSDTAQQIALGHVILNLGIVFAFTPVLRPFSNWIEKILPGKEDSLPLWPEFLDEKCVEGNPQEALNCVQKELMREAVLAGRMAEEAMSLLTDYKKGKTKNIFYLELVVDNLRTSIIRYLWQVSCRSLSEEHSRKLFAYTAMAEDIERIGDHCVNLADLARDKNERHIEFTKAAYAELGEIRKLNLESIADVIKLLDSGGKGEILAIHDREEKIDIAVWDAREKHLERFHDRQCHAEAGPVYIEMLVNLERISDHCQNIAEYVAGIQSVTSHKFRSAKPVTI